MNKVPIVDKTINKLVGEASGRFSTPAKGKASTSLVGTAVVPDTKVLDAGFCTGDCLVRSTSRNGLAIEVTEDCDIHILAIFDKDVIDTAGT